MFWSIDTYKKKNIIAKHLYEVANKGLGIARHCHRADEYPRYEIMRSLNREARARYLPEMREREAREPRVGYDGRRNEQRTEEEKQCGEGRKPTSAMGRKRLQRESSSDVEGNASFPEGAAGRRRCRESRSKLVFGSIEKAAAATAGLLGAGLLGIVIARVRKLSGPAPMEDTILRL